MALSDNDSNQGIYTISLYDSQDFSSRRELRPKSLISVTSDCDDTTKQNTIRDVSSGSEVPPITTNSDQKQMKNKFKMKREIYFLIDILILICVITLVIGIERGWIPTKRGGFFCNDPKISHKYHGDTITTQLLLIVSVLVPIVFFYVSEVCVYLSILNNIYDNDDDTKMINSNNNKNNYLTKTTNNYKRKKYLLKLINKCGIKTLYRYREYMIGLGLLTVVVELAKVLFGEPRPHFLDTCQPDAVINCTSDSNQYITDYKCTVNLKSYAGTDSYKSFPSGHAAFSAYSGLFLVWYLHKRFVNINTKYNSILLKPIIQLMWITWMFITPLSRVTDFRHHWWDTLAGSILGLAFTFYTIQTISNNFLDDIYLINHNMNTKISDNQMINNTRYHHHPSIKRLLSTNSTTSSIVYKNSDNNDKELTDIININNTYTLQ